MTGRRSVQSRPEGGAFSARAILEEQGRGARQAGFNPVAIYSRNPANAYHAADIHNIGQVHKTLDELLDDERVQVLDIAVPPDVQPAVIANTNARKIRFAIRESPLRITSD